ncbi:hypothetical protein PanWU01x14_042130 [Parasponia andersonii]|uniref:RNase H type-1 domain-containing protein n=1 Tax=Parasponia andersonii TaxID=3476 RepID=A0A2P5DQM4_PARAD|nr:hypothetical protein PanWU01x14_042130 [Parasponia andersonii]
MLYLLTRLAFERRYVILWCIWNDGNQVAHGGSSKPVVFQISFVDVFLAEYQTLQTSVPLQSTSRSPSETLWSLPPFNQYKLNTDATVIEGDRRHIGVGAVIRNHAGQVVAAMSKKIPGRFSVEAAELLAVCEGLLLAGQAGIPISLSFYPQK